MTSDNTMALLLVALPGIVGWLAGRRTANTAADNATAEAQKTGAEAATLVVKMTTDQVKDLAARLTLLSAELADMRRAMTEKDLKIHALEQENTTLRAEVDRLKTHVARLEARSPGSPL